MPDHRTSADSAPTTYNILFVCSGNTCRSPMAEAIGSEEIRRREWTHVAVRSAGTAAAEGMPASICAVEVAAEHGLDLTQHESHALTPELISWADLILAMSASHLLAVNELGGGEKAALITDFMEGSEGGVPVEDPFGSDCEAYRRTFEQLEESIQGLLMRLEPILSP